MRQTQHYLILDIGTGNVRVALTQSDGTLIRENRDEVKYEIDPEYPDALYFDPIQLWNQIDTLIKSVLDNVAMEISAVTTSSQREGIVLIDSGGTPFLGLPNHDHRGREWEHEIPDKDQVYRLTGRYPASLFSAMKLMGLRKKYPDLYGNTARIMSLSDWALFMLSGNAGYEHAQASETLLYDVANMRWSEALCTIFGVDQSMLPELHDSGKEMGTILPELTEKWGVPEKTPVIVGGADTQLAVKSTMPETGDIVLVSGTTTPVVKLTRQYKLDENQRTWTGRHITKGEFTLEANTGVTGLNYQRLKHLFYPNQEHQEIEQEISDIPLRDCIASLGSMIAGENPPLTKGGFIFDTPVSHTLTRGVFIKSALWDIACSIKENLDVLSEIESYDRDYLWGCGGGFQSRSLAQFLASLTGKRILLRDQFSYATVAGGTIICAEVNGTNYELQRAAPQEIHPETTPEINEAYKAWRKLRADLRNIYT